MISLALNNLLFLIHCILKLPADGIVFWVNEDDWVINTFQVVDTAHVGIVMFMISRTIKQFEGEFLVELERGFATLHFLKVEIIDFVFC